MTANTVPDSGILEDTREDLKKPEMFKVVLLNDHYTPMDFVVSVLRAVFHKNIHEATRITLDVHRNGRGIAGVYIYDIAATKIEQVRKLARKDEYPLRCTLEKA